MYCVNCGSEVKEGARFCVKCGASVDYESTDIGNTTVPMPPVQLVQATSWMPTVPNEPVNFAEQMESDRGRSRKKLSPLMIVVLVLALLAGTALAATFILRQQAGETNFIGGNASGSSAGATTFISPSSGSANATGASGSASASSASGASASSASSSASSAAASSASSASTSALTAAEAEAIKQAKDAGKTVFTGTVFIGTESEWAAKLGKRAGNPGSTSKHAGIILSEPMTLEVHDGAHPQNLVTRTGTVALLGSSSAADSWASYVDKQVSVASSDIYAFSDTLGELFDFNCSYSCELIVPTAKADQSAREQRPSGIDASDGYVLPDSNKREYSRAELEKYDNYTLFLARNEIYARHGRKFVNETLQKYFGSKSWYRGTVEPDDFSTSVFNDVEQKNANRMREIEEERKSPYL